MEWIKPKWTLCLPCVHVKEYAVLYAMMCQNQCRIQDLRCGLRVKLNNLIYAEYYSNKGKLNFNKELKSRSILSDLLFEDVVPINNPGLLNILKNVCESFTASCNDYDL
jgi:hypothetical protein